MSVSWNLDGDITSIMEVMAGREALPAGRKVALELARGVAYLPGTRVKLSVHQKESNGVRWLDYEFVEYEQPSK